MTATPTMAMIKPGKGCSTGKTSSAGYLLPPAVGGEYFSSSGNLPSLSVFLLKRARSSVLFLLRPQRGDPRRKPIGERGHLLSWSLDLFRCRRCCSSCCFARAEREGWCPWIGRERRQAEVEKEIGRVVPHGELPRGELLLLHQQGLLHCEAR